MTANNLDNIARKLTGTTTDPDQPPTAEIPPDPDAPNTTPSVAERIASMYERPSLEYPSFNNL